MSWQPEIDELRKREALAKKMGGPEKVKRQHDGGKLTVRERIGKLLDPGSFREVGAIAGKAEYNEDGSLKDFSPSNFVCGRGRINDRPVVVGGDDFTVRGGAADASIWEKQVISEQMAGDVRIPIVRLVDGTGGGGSVKTYEMTGRTYVPRNPAWEHVVRNLSLVPTVALGLGSVAGLGAARLVTSHYSLMVKNVSQMFAAGPPVVARLGTPVTKEELGGTQIHARNGSVDDEVESEEEAFARTRQFLSYMPNSVYDLPPRGPVTDDPNRREEKLLSLVPRERRKVYKMRDIIGLTMDQGSFFEIGKLYGRSIVTGLARLDGWPVAVMGGDPFFYGAAWSAETAHKVTRFVDMAETFHLPVVHFVDCPGFVIGVEAETAATIRHGARAMAAVYQATAPWCSIIVRKVFGVAGAAHQNWNKFNFRYAWPSGDWGSLPLEGGIEAAYKSDLAASDNPEKLLEDITERMNKVRSPFRTAETFGVEEIIDPRDTRPLLCEFANLAAPLRTPGPRATGFRP
ncbi:MAG: methylmalonyl-CoA carboxyltransferase [Alphaproteobacteria bacterium]|jgi:acetyl-CoA carboxylase carboxyltransferase component|nr:methylmalonyl-CoA carboxyltransferase [Alphaproteobacteria bacterium]